LSDFARLKEKLGKLRQVEPRAGGGRILAGQDAAARLRAALTEIDETILPRRITFTGTKGRAVVGVANRQLSLILEGVSSAGASPHVIDGRDDPALAELRDGLMKMFDGGGTWTVLTDRLERDHVRHMRPDGGVSASVLASVWNVEARADEDGKDATRAAGRFIERMGARCEAWLLIEGEEIAASGGSDIGIEWLSERAGGFLDGYYAKREAFTSGEPIAFAFSGGTGASLIYFESGDQAGFATLPPHELNAALGEWTASGAT
jgi:hypothetical protein